MQVKGHNSRYRPEPTIFSVFEGDKGPQLIWRCSPVGPGGVAYGTEAAGKQADSASRAVWDQPTAGSAEQSAASCRSRTHASASSARNHSAEPLHVVGGVHALHPVGDLARAPLSFALAQSLKACRSWGAG